jgi:hypothetical protein
VVAALAVALLAALGLVRAASEDPERVDRPRAGASASGTRSPLTSPTPATSWRPYYATRFQTLDGWTAVRETRTNDNSVNLPDNVQPASLGDGTGLSIVARREPGFPRPHTSGELRSRDPRIVLPNYFRAEVTGTIMDATGLWPCLL